MNTSLNPALLQAHLRYQLERHGWLAAVSLLVLLLALGLQFFVVSDMQAQNSALRAHLATQRLQAPPLSAADERDKTQAEFLASLPDTSAALEVIAVLNRAASHHQVQLSNAEYRLSRQGEGALMRYQINLPLKADYVHLHAWLAEVMDQLPNAALDELSLKREDTAQPVLDARVRLSVFLKAPS